MPNRTSTQAPTESVDALIAALAPLRAIGNESPSGLHLDYLRAGLGAIAANEAKITSPADYKPDATDRVALDQQLGEIRALADTVSADIIWDIVSELRALAAHRLTFPGDLAHAGNEPGDLQDEEPEQPEAIDPDEESWSETDSNDEPEPDDSEDESQDEASDEDEPSRESDIELDRGLSDENRNSGSHSRRPAKRGDSQTHRGSRSEPPTRSALSEEDLDWLAAAGITDVRVAARFTDDALSTLLWANRPADRDVQTAPVIAAVGKELRRAHGLIFADWNGAVPLSVFGQASTNPVGVFVNRQNVPIIDLLVEARPDVTNLRRLRSLSEDELEAILQPTLGAAGTEKALTTIFKLLKTYKVRNTRQ